MVSKYYVSVATAFFPHFLVQELKIEMINTQIPDSGTNDTDPSTYFFKLSETKQIDAQISS